MLEINSNKFSIKEYIKLFENNDKNQENKERLNTQKEIHDIPKVNVKSMRQLLDISSGESDKTLGKSAIGITIKKPYYA